MSKVFIKFIMHHCNFNYYICLVSNQVTRMLSDRNDMIKLPDELQEYFWDVDFHKLSLRKHSRFIAVRILNYGDPVSVQWFLSWADQDFLKKLLISSRNLNAKTRNFWKLKLTM